MLISQCAERIGAEMEEAVHMIPREAIARSLAHVIHRIVVRGVVVPGRAAAHWVLVSLGAQRLAWVLLLRESFLGMLGWPAHVGCGYTVGDRLLGWHAIVH